MKTLQKTRKIIHLISTVWLIMTFFYVLINALRLWGVKWWVIFSLSSHTILFVFLLICLYLFAVYNGFVRNEESKNEHPLTRTMSYMILYDICPLLGALAGCFAITGADGFDRSFSVIAVGTFAVTFVFWIIIDPIINICEINLPEGRKLRKIRLEKSKKQKAIHKLEQMETLENLTRQQQAIRQSWQEKLPPLSSELKQYLSLEINKATQKKIVDIGLKAWQIGGIECMFELEKKALTLIDDKLTNKVQSRYLAILWDGIGEWKKSIAMEKAF